MKNIILATFLFFPLFALSQTEFDYYENLRLERQKNKIKTIEHFYEADSPGMVEYFYEDGNLQKIEIFHMNQLYILIDNITVNSKGLISYTQTEYGNPGNTMRFTYENVLPSDFYNYEFGQSTVTEIKLIFDSQNRLIEKKSFAEDYSLTEPLITEKFFYDESNRIQTSKFLSESAYTEIVSYTYDSNGLLIMKTYNSTEPTGEFIQTFKYTFY